MGETKTLYELQIDMAISNELNEMAIAVDECENGIIPRAMEKNLLMICKQYNRKEFCETNSKILREMTRCSVKNMMHDGTQLSLHMEIKMITEVDGTIFQLNTIPFFQKNSQTSYVLQLEGKDTLI